MLRPPDELGSVAFSQAHSVRGLLAMSPRVDRIKWSKAETACCIWLGGQHLSEKAIFGSARQERSNVISICESSRSCSLDTASATFSILFIILASQ